MKKQLTKEQAIEIGKSGIWEKWDDEKIVRFQILQQRSCIPLGVFHKAIESVLDRPVYIHEFALNYEGLIEEWLGTRKAPTFNEIIEMIPEEKRVLIELPNKPTF